MENSNLIYNKLEGFIKKYYTNELLKGIIFFIGLGLIYFLVTLFVEYFLWLKSFWRSLLFWSFVLVELLLIARYILFPISKLFKINKGLNYEQASVLIGNHFSDVSDKLTNYLQLDAAKDKSELLLASIEQKAAALKFVPFASAINFNGNKRYLPLAIFPLFLIFFLFISGNSTLISQSLNRVVHYKQQFLPPAPFQFLIVNTNLQTEQNKDFSLQVITKGKIVPENIVIHIDNESYFLEKDADGKFTYKFTKPTTDVEFYLEANTVISTDYKLKVVTVPSIVNFEMALNFPSYLNKKSEQIKGTGNAIIPEGTVVTWKMNTLATDQVDWTDLSNVFQFKKQSNLFYFSKNINQNTEYQIVNSNSKIKNYEKLNYHIEVIKDQFPVITVINTPDSLKTQKEYLHGQVSDDYGLSKLQIVYYEKDKPQTAKRGTIPLKKDIFDQFIFAFPSTLNVVQGVTYDYYFEIFDNDVLHGFKSSKTSVFSTKITTDSEKQDQIFKQQNDNISGIQKSLKSQDKQLSELSKLQKMSKEKDNFDFKDQQKVNDFVKRQQTQDEMMKQFAEKMKNNLEKFNQEKNDTFKAELEKRLENAAKEIEKNKKLLEELNQLNDKIKHDELIDKLDQFKQTAKTQAKSLEQLVELTKKYYVEKKAQQVLDKLNKLADKQENLSNQKEDNNTENQVKLNNEFDKIQEDLKQLDKDNKDLKKPIDIPKDEDKQKSIDEDQKKATDDLKKDSKDSAKKNQKSASKKMKEMAQKMAQKMDASEKEQMEEDEAMLRQILDNLLSFSFSQEALMTEFKGIKRISPSFNKLLKSQQNLKQQFTHVDDSLFTLSMRNPKISDNILKEVGTIHYNLDKSIETLADAQLPKGISHQQYSVSSSNKLADFLSDVLNNMQMSMSMSGAGKGKPKPGKGDGMQLPDIILKQESLAEKMKKSQSKGKKPGEGKEGKQGNSGNDGNEGKPSPSPNGKAPNGSSPNGQSGNSSDKSNGEGENGQDGEGNAKEIMQIYKEQQELREALQNELNKKGLEGAGQNAINQMKDLEKQLLNKGFRNENLVKTNAIKQELLKLDKAIQEQGEEQKRQSHTSTTNFSNPNNVLPQSIQQYLKSIEILNRQSLPLHSKFNTKTQNYFKSNDKF